MRNDRHLVGRGPRAQSLFDIGKGTRAGNQAAAVEASAGWAKVVGDAMARPLTWWTAWPVTAAACRRLALFLPPGGRIDSTYIGPGGNRFRPVGQVAFNLEDAPQRGEVFSQARPASQGARAQRK